MSLLDTASLIVTPNAYKEGKLYSVIPSDGSGDLSVTRATTATRVNSAGLVELVPYNLVRYSEDFSNADWYKSTVTVTANTATAPNGTATADTYLPTNANSSIFSKLNLNLSIGNYSAQIWVKGTPSSIGNTMRFWLWHISSSGSTGLTTVTLTEDWQLITISASVTSTGDTRLRIDTTNHTNPFYIWGAQLVEGTEAKDYFATETRLNIPRLDYSNGTCPSILLEPQRTNLALWSEQFDNAAWTKSETTISANSTISPSGLSNADTLTANGTSNVHQMLLTGFASLTSGNTYTTSIYAKAGTNNFIQIVGTALVYASSTYANYDLVNGVVGSVASGVTASIVSVGDGWYRCSMTATAISTSSSNSFIVVIINNANSIRGEVNTLTTSVYLWGAQLEAGAYATSYIPTTSASVTRNADYIVKTGISSLLNSTQGVLYFEAKALVNNTGTSVISISNGTNQNTLYLGYSGTANSLVAQLIVGGVAQCNFNHTLSNATDTHKVAVMYASNNAKFYVNGVQIDVDTTINVPSPGTFDRLLNNLGQGSFPFYSNLSSILYFNTTLTDDQLEALTGEGFDTYQLMAENLNYILQ